MIDPGLVQQIETLRGQANPRTIPGGLFAWFGQSAFPDGVDNVPTLSQQDWERNYSLLQNSGVVPGLIRPLYEAKAPTFDIRPDDPLPIAIANFRVTVWKADFARRLLQAAEGRARLDAMPANLEEVTRETRAFMAAGLLHDQFLRTQPVYRGERLRITLDERFHFTNPGDPLPDVVEVDTGDGKGLRRLRFGQTLDCGRTNGKQAELELRCRYGQQVLRTRLVIPLENLPVAPVPDETWQLATKNTSGVAWVYRAHGQSRLTHPVIIAEGFPGGYPYDYLYDTMNQSGTMERLRAMGYDVILVGFKQGAGPIQVNAEVAMACIERVKQLTPAPLVVGGVSMGGLVTRYALAYMEAHGIPHQTRLYLTIDTPHRGAYTNLGDQWFIHYFRPAMAQAQAAAAILDSPANQQFVMKWVHRGQAAVSPLREEFVRQLEAIGGYPQQLRRIAVACGRGDGRRGSVEPGQVAVRWSGSPFVSAELRTLPEQGEGQATIGQGYCLVSDPDEPSRMELSSDICWEGAPGGSNIYNLVTAQIADGLGYGTIETPVPVTCTVPTVSALDLNQSPFEPVPPPGSDHSPFHDYICSDENEHHLKITPKVGDWLVKNLGAPDAPALEGKP